MSQYGLHSLAKIKGKCLYNYRLKTTKQMAKDLLDKIEKKVIKKMLLLPVMWELHKI